MTFLDVPGASGARYRFRPARITDLPATGGNVVAVTGASVGQRFVLCAAACSLGRAGSDIQAALRDAPQAEVFIRLNVARAVREAEHADIVAAVAPLTELPSLDG